jgi:hypothetical protein
MACFNKNIAEYKELKAEFGQDIIVDAAIINYQRATNSDIIPNLSQVQQMQSDMKVMHSTMKREFGQALVKNLITAKLATKKYKGFHYVNATDGQSLLANERILRKNESKIYKYLDANNIPAEVITIQNTKRSAKIIVNDNLFKISDIVPERRPADTTRTLTIIEHLERMFPQVEVSIVSEAQAEQYYNSLDPGQKSRLKFKDIKSYYVNGKAVLIQGRVDSNTAIEEILHPFIDAIKVENSELFDNLLKESQQTFPELKQQIDDAYNNKKGFNQLHRDLELVTQSLTRHFALEYETTPSKSFLDRVNDFIKWFADIIESLHKFITEGGTPVFKVSQIQARTNLSDIAKMLNTTDISFQLEKKADGRVRYALSTEKQRIVNHVLSQATTEAQKKIVQRLFNIAIEQADTIDSLSAGPESGESIVILNKEDHTYYDITTGQQFLSATTAINGKLQNELEIQENLAVGNDFDAVVDAILADITADKLFENLQQEEGSKFKSNRFLLDMAYNDLSNYLRGLKADGTIFIPQVVAFDSASGIAGTADIVGITPKGTIKIIDLKTSKTPYSTTGKEMYKRQWNLQNDSLLKQKGVERLSTRGKHGMQVNMYRRMFENMGYEVETGKYAATTFHIQVDISGKGKNQKFLGTYTMGDMISHPPTLNMDYVDMLIPENLDTIAREKIDEIRKDSAQFDPVNDPDFIEDDIEYPTSPEFDQTRYKAVNSNLKNYQKHIRERKKELENYKKRLFVDKTNEQALQYTNNALASIMVALDTTNPDSVALQSNVYSQLIRDAIKEINGFVDFISDAKNFNDPNFITYLMNFKKFAQSYMALKSGSKSDLLNKNELRLVNSLADKLELVEGTNYNEGLIRKAMLDWGVEYTRNNSNKDFSEKELRKLVLQAEDLSFFNLNTRDLATLPDTLLALVAKEFSRARLRGQARADETNVKTRALGNKLYRLDGSKEPRKVFEFMAEMKEGKFTGRFVQKLGDKYWGKHEELRGKLIHENGDWKEYREIGDLETANPLDIEYNLELYRDRQAHSAFWRPETMDEDGNAVAGEFHEYTQEWKDIRSKLMTYVPQGTHGYWIFKSGVTTEQQEQFYLEHYDVVEDGHVMEIKGGEPTGRLIPAELKFPKRKYRQPREDRADIQSDKYNKLMSDNSALGIARRDFYNHYMEEYGRQLKKLPMSVRDQMLGYAPIVRGKILADATKKGILPGFLRNIGRNIKDTFTTTQSFRRVATDEYGNLIDSIPIMFVGRPVTQKEIDAVEERIAQVEEARTSKKITGEEYKAEMKLLDGQRKAILGRPNADQVSMDFADSLIKFTAMSSMYEAMDDIEDTLLGIKDIVDQRTYSENQGKGVVKVVKGAKDSIQELAGKRGNKSMEQENTKKRLAAWMSMTFYNSDEMTRTVMDKLTNAAIQYSSLSYVAFNAIGNLNNLAIASANNSIEALGQRFFSRKSYGRANSEFYGLNVGQGIMKRLSYSSRKGGGDRYDPRLPMNKWEGMALNDSMMDAYADIRESIQGQGALNDDMFTLENIKTFGYSLQDAAEYKVQTTVGMAILMDLTMLNRVTGDRLSYYDAHDFDSKTQSVKLKDGFDTVVEKDLNGKETLKPFTENYKFDLRMKIREVNKQIHGNYAREDRVILQRHNIGALIFQFKKWLAPAIRARFQREYFDENLGWMEGRYISAIRFFGYFFKQVGQANFKAANFKTYMEDQYGKEGQGAQEQERLQNQVLGIKRTFADLSMILAAMISHSLLMGLFEDDDDDMDPTLRRLRNLAIYQADRTYKELVMYIPISPTGIVQAGEFISDPIASARNLGQIGEVFTSAFTLSYQNLKMRTPVGGLDGEWGVSRREQRALLNNSSIYYQYKPRKGQLKLRKELFDAIPALYTIQKWQGFLKRQDFYID